MQPANSMPKSEDIRAKFIIFSHSARSYSPQSPNLHTSLLFSIYKLFCIALTIQQSNILEASASRRNFYTDSGSSQKCLDLFLTTHPEQFGKPVKAYIHIYQWFYQSHDLYCKIKSPRIKQIKT